MRVLHTTSELPPPCSSEPSLHLCIHTVPASWAVLSPTPLTQDEVRVCKAALVTNLGEIISNGSV